MTWELVVLILGIVWAIVAFVAITGWVSTFDKDDLSGV